MAIDYIHTNEVSHKAKDFDIIFNTIDVTLFKDFENIKNCYLYDLSTKGCLDFEKINNRKKYSSLVITGKRKM